MLEYMTVTLLWDKDKLKYSALLIAFYYLVTLLNLVIFGYYI